MRIIILTAAFLFLTGCSSLFTSKEEIRDFYVLNPIEEVIQVQHASPVRVGLQRPAVPEWLDTQHIMLRREQNQVDFYAGARWVMNAGDMIGTITAESLQNNRMVDDVYYSASETISDYMLVIEVLAFDAYYESEDSPPIVEVSLQGRLLAMPNSDIHYSFTTTHRTQAESNRMKDIIEAFDESNQACMMDVVKQTAKGLAVKYETF